MNEELEREEELEEEEEEEVEEEAEEEEYESEEEEVASDEEDPLIPIVYEKDGESIERELKYSELSEIVKNYDQYNQNLNQYAEYINAVSPIVETIKQSQLLQSILYYKAQGYSEDQIKEGLAKLWSQEITKEEPEYESYEEEIKAKLFKELENRLKPLESKAQSIILEKEVQQITEHNNQVLRDVLNEMGIETLTTEQLKQVGQHLSEMFPGQDFRLLRLNKTIAKALISLVAEPKIKQKKASEVSKKVAKLPKIISSTKGVRTTPEKNLRGKDVLPMSLEDRIKLKKELFGS
ncbi:hypothetical protein [Caldisericum sp.]|uniref:hypothetical protein n=1 Tax=Caldisericum sp. TaxID=2499687 RepID=UPI003D113880